MRTNRYVRPLILAALLLLVCGASGCQILFRALTPTSTPDEFFEDWASEGSPAIAMRMEMFLDLEGLQFPNRDGSTTTHWHDRQQAHESGRRLRAWASAFDGIAYAASTCAKLGLWAYSPPLARSTRLRWKSQSDFLRRYR